MKGFIPKRRWLEPAQKPEKKMLLKGSQSVETLGNVLSFFKATRQAEHPFNKPVTFSTIFGSVDGGDISEKRVNPMARVLLYAILLDSNAASPLYHFRHTPHLVKRIYDRVQNTWIQALNQSHIAQWYETEVQIMFSPMTEHHRPIITESLFRLWYNPLATWLPISEDQLIDDYEYFLFRVTSSEFTPPFRLQKIFRIIPDKSLLYSLFRRACTET